MGARGRKPAAELSVVAKIEPSERPSPPSDLTKEQSAEWMRVVNRLPADWFPEETHAMLAQYCRHFSASRQLALMVAEMQSRPVGTESDDLGEYFSLDEYDKLLKMQERESRAMTALARSLRFTLQASYDKEKSKGTKNKARPY